MFSTIFFYFSSGIASFTYYIRPLRSPSPSSLLMKLPASNGSKSSKCSPVPMNMTGLYVAATALNAPPPFACPSSLVTITEPTLMAFVKARAWS